LVVVGSGDPTIGGRFTGGDPTEYFRRWAKVLKQQRVTHIRGDLLLDDSCFDRQFVHPNWPKADLGHWYAAPIGALVFNDSCIDVHVAPGASAGAAGEVTLVPSTQLFELVNRTRTVRTAKEHAPRVARGLGSRTIQCDGPVYGQAQPTTTWLPVDDPVQYFGSVMREVLSEEGIRIDGSVRSEPGAGRRSDFEPRIVHRFALLPALEVTNKESQNLYAEQVFKTLGISQRDGSWNGGKQAVRAELTRLGLDAKSYVIDDGCGLSRSNRASPRAFTSLLAVMHAGSHAEQFRDTLSITGVDGTLKKRLTEEPYRGRVWAKTGSISGVRSISGYVQTLSGEWLAFSFLANNVRVSVRAVQDDFCKALVHWPHPVPERRVAQQPRKSSK
jgi:D-alanyl-D-alanine carboxypeptidase/D-alanyl-D-alanine-endopeptidase (penicillin-binding protein 4)